MSIDPLTVITTISAGLRLIDQFRDLALRILGGPVRVPSETLEQVGTVIQKKRGAEVLEEVSADELDLSQWDDVRYRALERRVRLNWELYNELDAQRPLLSVEEKARIELRMEEMRAELCADFRMMQTIVERTLGIGLPDHYSLYEVC